VHHAGHGDEHGHGDVMDHHAGHGDDEHGHAGHHAPDPHGSGAAAGIEWEDDMVEVNRQTTEATMQWKFLDRTAGAGSTGIDWRFDVSNPGLWMAHCHIAEHMQSGMMFSFTVARQPAGTR
jgi:FtsP/CotA-like multicopper oxidase with cupredoxin domain